jgi:hypothetical protein
VFRCVLGSEGCVLVPRFSGTPVATWAWPTWVVSCRSVLEAAFILLEFPSPSRRIFIGSHSLPPSLVRRIGPSGGQWGAPASFGQRRWRALRGSSVLCPGECEGGGACGALGGPIGAHACQLARPTRPRRAGRGAWLAMAAE